MKDAISITRISTLHPKVRQPFTDFIDDCEQTLGITIRAIQALRTFAEQDELYSHGRTKFVDEHGNKLGIVTQAKGGQSFHNYGLCLDLAVIENGKVNWNYPYKKLGDIAKIHNIEWGGLWKFKDNPHFQITFGFSWQQLLEKHNKGEVDSNGYVLI